MKSSKERAEENEKRRERKSERMRRNGRAQRDESPEGEISDDCVEVASEKRKRTASSSSLDQKIVKKVRFLESSEDDSSMRSQSSVGVTYESTNVTPVTPASATVTPASNHVTCAREKPSGRDQIHQKTHRTMMSGLEDMVSRVVNRCQSNKVVWAVDPAATAALRKCVEETAERNEELAKTNAFLSDSGEKLLKVSRENKKKYEESLYNYEKQLEKMGREKVGLQKAYTRLWDDYNVKKKEAESLRKISKEEAEKKADVQKTYDILKTVYEAQKKETENLWKICKEQEEDAHKKAELQTAYDSLKKNYGERKGEADNLRKICREQKEAANKEVYRLTTYAAKLKEELDTFREDRSNGLYMGGTEKTREAERASESDRHADARRRAVVEAKRAADLKQVADAKKDAEKKAANATREAEKKRAADAAREAEKTRAAEARRDAEKRSAAADTKRDAEKMSAAADAKRDAEKKVVDAARDTEKKRAACAQKEAAAGRTSENERDEEKKKAADARLTIERKLLGKRRFEERLNSMQTYSMNENQQLRNELEELKKTVDLLKNSIPVPAPTTQPWDYTFAPSRFDMPPPQSFAGDPMMATLILPPPPPPPLPSSCEPVQSAMPSIPVSSLQPIYSPDHCEPENEISLSLPSVKVERVVHEGGEYPAESSAALNENEEHNNSNNNEKDSGDGGRSRPSKLANFFDDSQLPARVKRETFESEQTDE